MTWDYKPVFSIQKCDSVPEELLVTQSFNVISSIESQWWTGDFELDFSNSALWLWHSLDLLWLWNPIKKIPFEILR